MANDISDYLEFGNDGGDFKKASLKSFLDKNFTVCEWTECTSRFKDGNTSGKYARMIVEYNNEKFTVNSGSAVILEQLNKIKAKKIEKNETDMSFSCCLKKYGNGHKFYPANFEVKNG